MIVKTLLNIYPDAIEGAWGRCMDTLEEEGLGNFSTELERRLEQDIEDVTLRNLTNDVITIMFQICADIIKREHPGQDVSFYVNCEDSHIYTGTNPESVEGRLEAAGLTADERGELLRDSGFEQDLRELFETGHDVIVFESKEECREEHIGVVDEAEELSGDAFCETMEQVYFNIGCPEAMFITLDSGRVVIATE